MGAPGIPSSPDHGPSNGAPRFDIGVVDLGSSAHISAAVTDHHDPRDTDVTSVAPAPAHEEAPAKAAPVWRVGLVLAALLAGVGWLLLGSEASDAFVYSKLVHEVAQEPDDFAGREMRVEGDLREGSIQFREEPCEWRFVLEKEGSSMPVSFPQCVVPDTFRDGMGISVTVQGQIQSDGTFVANQVVPKCPSKYEMDEAETAGVERPYEVPHAPTPTASSEGTI